MSRGIRTTNNDCNLYTALKRNKKVIYVPFMFGSVIDRATERFVGNVFKILRSKVTI